MKKKISFELEIPENIAKFVAKYAEMTGKDEGECYMQLMELGFINGSTNYKTALNDGYNIEIDFIKDLPALQNLQKVANGKIEPANIVEKNLTPLVELIHDDSLAEKLKKEREMELKK